jgi:hypothetical protein
LGNVEFRDEIQESFSQFVGKNNFAVVTLFEEPVIGRIYKRAGGLYLSLEYLENKILKTQKNQLEKLYSNMGL